MRTLTVIQTTLDDQEVVDRITNGLLNEKLVACVQVTTVKSSYWWKNEIENVNEFLILFKLPQENKNRVIQYIESNHTYDIPEIIVEDRKTSEKYYEYCHTVCDI